MNIRSQGFTLPELMVTVAIAGILASLAMPNLNALVERNRISTATNQLVSSLLLMRSEATKRGFDVSMCAVNTIGNACDAAATDFSNGWIVFTDYRGPAANATHSNGKLDVGTLFDTDGDGAGDTAEEILARSDEASEGMSIYSNGTPKNSVTYRPTGSLSNRNGLGLSFFVAKDSTPKSSIKISMTGRVRSCTIATGKTNC